LTVELLGQPTFGYIRFGFCSDIAKFHRMKRIRVLWLPSGVLRKRGGRCVMLLPERDV
jgi:hypothetical protein